MQTGRRALEVRAVDHRHDVPDRRGTGRRGLLRRRGERRARDPDARRRALSPRRLAVGAERRPGGHARLDAGARLPAVPLGGLQRGAPPVRPGPRLADAPAAGGELRGVDADLPLEEALRPRVPVRRSALHPPALARLDRLSRHPGRLHARARHRLLREQPPRHLVQQQYAIRNPRRFEGYGEHCWGITASDGPGPATPPDRRRRAPLLRLHGARRPLRAGRRHDRPVGGGRLAAVRAGDRAADDPPLPARPTRSSIERLRLQVQLQPDLHGRVRDRGRVALAGLLRARPGSDRPDDRELPLGLPLAADAAVSVSSSRDCAAPASPAAGCRRRPERRRHQRRRLDAGTAKSRSAVSKIVDTMSAILYIAHVNDF